MVAVPRPDLAEVAEPEAALLPLGAKTMSFGPFSVCSPQRSYSRFTLPVAGSITSIRPPL
jgi:hypothetical protein